MLSLSVMGAQYNLLAHMLLVVHDPTIPQLGPSHKQSRAAVDVRGLMLVCHIFTHFVRREWRKTTFARCVASRSQTQRYSLPSSWLVSRLHLVRVGPSVCYLYTLNAS